MAVESGRVKSSRIALRSVQSRHLAAVKSRRVPARLVNSCQGSTVVSSHVQLRYVASSNVLAVKSGLAKFSGVLLRQSSQL